MTPLPMLHADSHRGASLSPIASVELLSSRMALAAMLKNSPSALSDAQTLPSLSLAEYRAALAAMIPAAQLHESFDVYLRRFLPTRTPMGVSSASVNVGNYPDGDYLFAIISTDINGTPWTAAQVAAGEQFYLSAINSETGLTLASDRYPLVLPTCVRDAGVLRLNISSVADKGQHLVTLLRQTYASVMSVIDSA